MITVTTGTYYVPSIQSGALPKTTPQTQDPTSHTSDTFKPTEIATSKERTALQKHVDFFERNKDSKITVGETYEGLRALGLGRVRAALNATAINGGLGLKTGSPWHSPFTVNTNSIELAKHPSDTDIYDEKGHFDQAKFEALFTNYDLNKDTVLSQEEFINFRQRNKESAFSAIASKGEFDLLMELGGEEREIDGKKTAVLTRERLAEFYNGSLFYHLAGESVPF